MAACAISNQQFSLQEIDTLKGDNRQPRYLQVNPTGHIPLIEDGPYKVLGGNHLVYVYVCKSKQ